MSLASDQAALVRALLQGAPIPGIDPDGLEMASLLVWKLRFERLLRGSVDCARLFDKDPESFTALFRRYHRAVPPSTYFPAEEARRFQEWLDASNG